MQQTKFVYGPSILKKLLFETSGSEMKSNCAFLQHSKIWSVLFEQCFLLVALGINTIVYVRFMTGSFGLPVLPNSKHMVIVTKHE